MVKKLFKHEFLSYMRALLPMHLIMLGIAALTRFVYFFESDTTYFEIVGTSSVVAFVISCVVCLVLSYLTIITRFYKNMFTFEGYLSFTLPVTNFQHIMVKALTGTAVIVIDFVAIILAICVATAGELTVELFKAGAWILKQATDGVGWQLWLYIPEFIVVMLVSVVGSILMFYSCIAIGQLSNKNRVLLAIGVYFAYYFVTQVLSTILIVAITGLSYTNWFNELFVTIGDFVTNHPYTSCHLLFLILFVFAAVFGLIFYFITHRIMQKKLNLE